MKKKKVLVVGDVFIDEYTYASTCRTAQEADIPVYDYIKTEARLGGAGNVAANIKSLDPSVSVELLSICDGQTRGLIQRSNLSICSFLCRGVFGQTIRKRRIVCNDKIVSRLDSSKSYDELKVHYTKWIEVLDRVKEFNLIVISDYDKGTVGNELVSFLINSGVPVIVDSKRWDLNMFRGSRCLNINFDEYARQKSNCHLYENSFEELFESVIVTDSSNPTTHLQYETIFGSGTVARSSYKVHEEQFSVSGKNSIDVTGCGDTHTAAVAVGLLRDRHDIRSAIRYANVCASIAVTKQGTSVVSNWEFLKETE